MCTERNKIMHKHIRDVRGRCSYHQNKKHDNYVVGYEICVCVLCLAGERAPQAHITSRNISKKQQNQILFMFW